MTFYYYILKWGLRYTFIASISLLFSIAVQGQELAVYPAGTQFVAAGHRIIIMCAVTDTDIRVVDLKWYNMYAEEILETTGRVYIEEVDDRFLRLKIENIVENDAGAYTCFMETVEGFRESVTVHLQIFKRITFDYAPELQNPVEYNDELIHCRVSGNPAPEVSWRYRGQTISTGGRYVVEDGGLRIQHITKDDDGLYECRGEISSMGMMDSRTISVVVSSESTVPGMPEGVEIIEATSTMLSVKVINPHNDGGMPIIAYRVDYNGINTIYSKNPETDVVVLTVENLAPSTAYIFNIRAVNEIGVSPSLRFAHHTMSISKPQKIIIISDPEGSNPYDYTLLWEKARTGGHPILEYRFQYGKVSQREDGTDVLDSCLRRLKEDDLHNPISSYRLEGLQQDTKYGVSVETRNEIGWSETSDLFVFQTAEDTQVSAQCF